MPYKTNADLPDAVRDALPDGAQTVFRAAYAEAEKKWPGDDNEGRRASYAWGAVKQAGYEKGEDGKWSKSESATESAGASVEIFGHRLVRGKVFARESGPETGDLLPVRVVEDARHKPTEGDYHIVIVGAGANEQKRRVYPNETIEGIDLALYENRKMYLDHDVRDGEAGGVRSVRDYAAQVTQPWLVKASENAGVAEVHAIAHVFPDIPGFSANMKDPVYRKGVATSHVFGYNGYLAREESTGKTWEVITGIKAVDSVDWVTEPGARGRVAENNAKENNVDMTRLTADELRKARPDLIQEITDGAVAAHRARENDSAAETDLKARLAAEQTARETAEAELRKVKIASAVETAVTAKDSGIPETVRTEVAQELTAQVAGLPPDKIAGESLGPAVEQAVKGKAAFLKKLVAGPEVKVTTGQRDGGNADGNQSGENVVRSWFR
jgi:cation transport regulator